MKEIFDSIVLEAYGSWRFRWLALAAAWLVAMAGWTWLALTPNVYEANARVYVNTTSALRPLLDKLTVTPDIISQLDQVKLAMLGRAQLQKVARSTGLDLKASNEEELDAVLLNLRNKVTITGGQEKGRRRGEVNNLYTISFLHPDREKAVEVVETLLNTFVEDSLGESRRGGESAQKFLQEEIRKTEARLSTAESALADFRREYQGLMPDEQGTFLGRLQAMESELAGAIRERKLAETRRAQIMRQLNSEQPLMPGGIGNEAPPQNSLDARIQENEAELENMLLRFTEKHPQVVALRETLADLKDKRAKNLAELGVRGTDANLGSLDTNPVYQALRGALSEVEIEIARVNVIIDDLQGRIAVLNEKRDEAPEVEAQLARLNRDYDIVKNQYAELTRRLEVAKLSEQATRSDDVDFRLIDPPTASFEPVAPDRLLLVLGILLGGLAVGGAIAFLMHQLKPVFNTRDTLRKTTGLPVIGSVGIAFRDRFKGEARRKLMVFTAGTVGLLLMCAITLGLNLSGVFPLT